MCTPVFDSELGEGNSFNMSFQNRSFSFSFFTSMKTKKVKKIRRLGIALSQETWIQKLLAEMKLLWFWKNLNTLNEDEEEEKVESDKRIAPKATSPLCFNIYMKF